MLGGGGDGYMMTEDVARMGTLISWLFKRRYVVLSLALFGVMCLITANGQMGEDFWEHSAVVRELATHTLHPRHPEFLLDAPHAFYSPYALSVALLSRAAHADAVAALSFAGLFNLALFLFGLRFFVSSVVPEHRDATAFYTLLLVLFWWGADAWFYGGFFHLRILGFVLAYPSTFAASLTFIAFGLYKRQMADRRRIWLVPIFLIAATVLLCHPLTFLFLATGLVAMPWGEEGNHILQTAQVAALLSLAFLFASLWHYFPLLKLLTRESDVYHASNIDVYRRVLGAIWPALVGVPLVFTQIRSRWCRPLLIMLVVLSALYLYGDVSGKYSYGRVIAYVVLLLHVTIAERLAALEARVGALRPASALQRLIVPACVVIFTLCLSFEPLRDTFERARPDGQPDYKAYLFLSQYTGQYEVVLSDLQTSWMVPTFGGKIVAMLHAAAFVPDQGVRRSDVDHFFSAEATPEDRQRIIEKYGVRYLLLNKSSQANWQELQREFAPTGRLAFENDKFVLISLRPQSEP
ncbi:MAG: hypothetical protein QOF61_1271 [Acidobacteriota bacterium]|nr:hypothetical protein [Acidobacteriota bacterium]